MPAACSHEARQSASPMTHMWRGTHIVVAISGPNVPGQSGVLRCLRLRPGARLGGQNIESERGGLGVESGRVVCAFRELAYA